MNVTPAIQANRAAYLHELRTTSRPKGTLKSDERGRPVFETEADKHGACACAIMTEMFGQKEGKLSPPQSMKALGITAADCKFIQQQLNDTPLTFPEIANRIESEVFNKRP